MVLKTFSSFWMPKSKSDKKGNCPVYMRIQVGDSRSEINTGVKVPDKYWNSQAQKVLSKHPDSETSNETLEILREKFNETHRDLLKSRVPYTAETLKKRMLGEKEAAHRTLMEAIVSHNNYLKSLVGKDYAPATVIRYKTLTNLLTVFLSDTYQRNDFLLSELSVKFLQDFEHYLKTVRNCNHNTTAKYLKNLKKVINTAIVNQWIEKNPFLGYKITIKQTMKDYLVEEELKRIESKTFPMERLEAIRKIFLFQCYTGLAYIDVKGLTMDNIVSSKGNQWLVIERAKTDSYVRIPLIKKALELIKEVKHPKRKEIFKVPSNQKMNAYLKEIADLCEIEKEVSSHTARRTFATLALTKGVSIEAVSKALGHANIQTTQIYAKVTSEKLISEFERFE